MRKSFLTLLVLYLSGISSFAQDRTRFFEIGLAKYKVSNSLYNKIGFLDSRYDNSYIGTVNIGLLKNQEAKLLLRSPILPQLTNLLNSLTDSSAKDGELLFQLKDLSFVETTGTRYCSLNGELYAKENDQYKKLSSLDTVIIIRVSDITKALLSEGNKVLSDFMAKGLVKPATDTSLYSIGDLKNIDSIEKRPILAYHIEKYVDGIYTSYISFKDQEPDKQGLIDMKRDGSISSVKIIDADGKKIKIKPKNIYAVIADGKPFIATEYGFYPLERVNNNFLFTGDVRIAPSNGDMRTSQMAFGLIGAALESSGNQVTYEMIIDYQNGKFIHLRAIKKDPE
jgi:hypothetical protein